MPKGIATAPGAKSGTPCTVCHHPQRASADLALAAGKTATAVAATFRMSVRAVTSHRRSHLAPSLAKAAASREDVSANGVIDRMVELQSRTLSLLDAAEVSAKPTDVARIIRECRENELALARLTGLLREGSTTIDNRTQTINVMAGLSEEDLRSLASMGQRALAS